MIIFYSVEVESIGSRGAKLQVIKRKFGETTPPKPINMLQPGDLNTRECKTLIISGHGSRDIFMNEGPEQLCVRLIGAGLRADITKEIYLLSCNVGEQAQDNSIPENFARTLKRSLDNAKLNIKLYAPRGIVKYKNESIEPIPGVGERYRYSDVVIAADNKEYPLSEGLLLVSH